MSRAISGLAQTRYVDGDDLNAHITKMHGFAQQLNACGYSLMKEHIGALILQSMPASWSNVTLVVEMMDAVDGLQPDFVVAHLKKHHARMQIDDPKAACEKKFGPGTAGEMMRESQAQANVSLASRMEASDEQWGNITPGETTSAKGHVATSGHR